MVALLIPLRSTTAMMWAGGFSDSWRLSRRGLSASLEKRVEDVVRPRFVFKDDKNVLIPRLRRKLFLFFHEWVAVPSCRPDLFVKEINHLSAEAEARLAIILDHIRSVVRTKRCVYCSRKTVWRAEANVWGGWFLPKVFFLVMYCQIFPGLHFFLCCINCVHHPNAKNQWGLLFLWKLSVFLCLCLCYLF